MNNDRLRLALIQYEQCNLDRHIVVTKGQRGEPDKEIPHIGYGFNLDDAWDDELLDYLAVEDEDDIQSITQEQADWILEWWIDHAEQDAIKVFPKKWESLTPLRKEILVNLSYNLGLPTLKTFRKMIKNVRTENWNGAAVEMLDSDAARQTGDRYQKLAQAFETDSEIPLGLPQLFDAPELTQTIATPEGKIDLSQVSDAELITELGKRLGISYNGQIKE